MKIVIDVDDFHPEKGYGLYDRELCFMDDLHEQFGCKFTLFTPTNWHDEYDITHYTRWFKEISMRPWYEIGAHGILHSAPDGSSREFLFTTPDQLEAKCVQMKETFESLDYEVKGVRPPGWDMIPEAKDIFAEHFDYMATHHIGHEPVKYKDTWDVPYSYCIHDNFNLKSVESDTVILHAHANPKSGDNGWDVRLYQKIRDDLRTRDDLEYVLMKDIIPNG